MHAHSITVAPLLGGALLAGLLGFSSAASAQDEAVQYYNHYLEAKSLETTRDEDPTTAQQAAIANLEARINCLELTQMPCRGKTLVREADPVESGTNTTGVMPAKLPGPAVGTQPN